MEKKTMIRNHILVCGGTGCTSSGSQKIIDALNAELAKNNLQDEVKVVMTGCFGLCALGPIMIVYPEGAFYSRVEADMIPEIVLTVVASMLLARIPAIVKKVS